MSELKPYIGPHPTDHTLTEYYLKSEADRYIAELKERHKEEVDELQKGGEVMTRLKARIAELERMDTEHTLQIAKMNGYINHLEEERRWRKFSEEKPELGDVVLVKLSERVKGHYFPMDVVRWDSSYELGEIEVSHWMPLPTEPKDDKFKEAK